MSWFQYALELPAQRRGWHLITSEVIHAARDLRKIRIGLLHLYLQHTSASLSINENASPDVPRDLERVFNTLAPEDFDYEHTIEGPDDMPAHVKNALLGTELSIPISLGRLALGTWQGIYLCEHRDQASRRKLVITLQGECE